MCSAEKLMMPAKKNADGVVDVSGEPVKWGQIGDVAHAFNLANTIFFACCVATLSNTSSAASADGSRSLFNPFDPTWAKDGFCVSNPTTPYWTSHDLCLYGDVVLALVFGALYWSIRNTPGMKAANDLVFFNIPGIIGHGLGHGGIAAALRSGDMPEDASGVFERYADASYLDIAKEQAPFLVFWLFLLKASMPHASNGTIFFLSLLSMAVNSLIPQRFGFTYVQTNLLLAFTLNQLLRPRTEKGREYALYALMISVPLTFIGWLESTACSTFVIHIGGHIIYDFFIPTAMTAFYLLCYALNRGDKVKHA